MNYEGVNFRNFGSICPGIPHGISDMTFVCPRTFVNSTRTAGPIVTGEAPFDSPIRRKDDGADLGSISST